MKRAVVLGSGGIVGIAWLTGLVEALREHSIDLLDADAVLGTSAGSVVAARLTTRPRPDFAPAAAPALPKMGGLPKESVREIFTSWGALTGPDPKVSARIGELACQHEGNVDAYVRSYETMLGDPEWPERDLRLVTVSARTGERITLSRQSGPRLARAVAASCAVPAIFPPVPWEEECLMDGGVHSTTSADLLVGQGYDLVIVAMPTCAVTTPIMGALAERCVDQELARLRAEGVRVELVMPEPRDAEAYGTNLMDLARAAPTSAAARAQAAREAARLGAAWSAPA